MAVESTAQSIRLNYFPNTESYNRNKQQLTESDINLVPATTVVDTFSDGINWYRMWSDGWIEQGGYYTASSGNNTTVSLLVPFVNKPVITFGWEMNSTSNSERNVTLHQVTNTNFKTHQGIDANITIYWYACGY